MLSRSLMALSVALAVCLPLFAWGSAAAQGQAMVFQKAENGGTCDACFWIAAEGVITGDTPAAFRRFLVANQIGIRSAVRFHSPGGNLLAAVELGRIIRERGLGTIVGRTVRRSEQAWSGQEASGDCLSACAVAFLGGLQRTYDTRGDDQGGPSRLGFHQFYLTREPSLAAAATRLEALGLGLTMGQVIQGTLVAYAVEMGVDPRLFTRASQADRTEMWVLSGQEAETLKAVSSAQADPEWRLRAARGGLALVGVADLRPGSPFNVTLACQRGRPGALLLEISSPVPSPAWDSMGTQMLERAVVFSAAPADSERGPYEDLSRQPFQTVAGRIQSRITIEGRALQTLRSRGLKLLYTAPSGLYSMLPTFALSSREVGEAVDLLLRNCPRP